MGRGEFHQGAGVGEKMSSALDMINLRYMDTQDEMSN